MIIEVNAVDFGRNLGEMLNRVQSNKDNIVINKDGKPVAALVDAELFAHIRRMRDRLDALSQRIAEAHTDVPVEEGLAEIDSLVELLDVRRRRSKSVGDLEAWGEQAKKNASPAAAALTDEDVTRLVHEIP